MSAAGCVLSPLLSPCEKFQEPLWSWSTGHRFATYHPRCPHGVLCAYTVPRASVKSSLPLLENMARQTNVFLLLREHEFMK